MGWCGSRTGCALQGSERGAPGGAEREVAARRGGEQRARVLVLRARRTPARAGPYSTTRPCDITATLVADLRRDAQVVGDEQHREVQPRRGSRRAARAPAPAPTRRAPTPPRRRSAARAPSPARARCRCAGAGRRRTGADSGRARSASMRTSSSSCRARGERLGARHAVVHRPFDHRLADRAARVERAVRILEHDLHAPAQRRAARAARHRRDVVAAEQRSRRRSGRSGARCSARPSTCPSPTRRRCRASGRAGSRASTSLPRRARCALAEPAAGRRRSCSSRASRSTSGAVGSTGARAAASASAPRRSASACSRAAAAAAPRRLRARSRPARPGAAPRRGRAISATTPKSWVMNSTPVPWRACSSQRQLQDLRLRGDVERGGRLVGDQQRRLEHQRHRDHDALALAARELVRIATRPCARARAAAPRATMSSTFARRCGGARAACARAAPRRSGRRSVITGLSAVIGSWKIIDMRVARSSRRRAARRARDVLALQHGCCRRCTGSAFGSRPITLCAITDLPEPDSPTRQSDLAAADVERRRRAPPSRRSRARRQRDREAARPRGPARRVASYAACAIFGSSVSRRPSPRMLTASTVSARKMPGKKMLCGYCVELRAALGHDVAPGRDVGRQADAEERQDRLDQDRRRRR